MKTHCRLYAVLKRNVLSFILKEKYSNNRFQKEKYSNNRFQKEKYSNNRFQKNNEQLQQETVKKLKVNAN